MRGLKSNTMAGNMSNQRYEAEHHITRYLKVVADAEATRETSRWRDSLANEHLQGQDDKKLRKLHLKNLSLEHENEQLAGRIHTIMTECRQDATIEYTPGWRIGKVGTVIDCYASKKNDAEKFTTMHGRSIEAERAERKRQNVNMKLYNSIQRASSAYGVQDCMKHYEHNRRLARVLNSKVSHTTLHLGLVKAVKERELAKVKSKVQKTSGTKQQSLPNPTVADVASGSTGRAGLATNDSAVSSFGLSGPENYDGRPSTAAWTSTSVVDTSRPSTTRPATTGAAAATGTRHRATVSYNNAPASVAATAEIIGLRKNTQLAAEARDNAAIQTRLQQEYPTSYVYASSMGGIIDQVSVKPFTAPSSSSSSSSPKSTFFPTLLAPESLSASIAGGLWESFNRVSFVGPAVQEAPVERPRTSAGSNSSSIVRMDDWGQGAINGGWEASLVPMIRLGERSSDRRETWRESTRNVFLRKFPSENRPNTSTATGKVYAHRSSSPKGDRRLQPTALLSHNNNNSSDSPEQAVPTSPIAGTRQPYCPELVNIDAPAAGSGGAGLPGDGSIFSGTSALEGGASIDDGSTSVLPVDFVLGVDTNLQAVRATTGSVRQHSSVLRSPTSSHVASSLLERYSPPSRAQVRIESRRAKKKEEGWIDDYSGKHTKYNMSTVDVSVKGGRVRIAEGLFAPR